MDTSKKFSCFLLGEGTLPIQCAQVLVDREHTIYGIISSNQAVIDWARDKEIPYIDPQDRDIVTFLSQRPFDYLFSIVNPYILPKLALELPRQCAINYHNAPLPRYAGSYVTSWAIMQGERVHGVTWHAMTELVDGGDIFKQCLFEVEERETALTLDAKCYDAALSSFTELIDDISSDHVSARKQNLSERTFFFRNKRPSSACMLSWNCSARNIDAFVRALDFGPYANPMGLPKLAIGKDFIIVSEVEVFNSMSAVPPGTITHIDPGFVRVSTIDGEVALRKLLTIDGQSLSIPNLVAKFGLYEGYQFKELDQEVAARITAYDTLICRHEASWTKQLEALEKFTLPYMHRRVLHTQPPKSLHMPMLVPGEILNFFGNHYVAWRRGDWLQAAFAAYLARIGGVRSFDIGYCDVELQDDVAGLEGLFAAAIPLRIVIECEKSFAEIFHAVQEQVKLAKKRKTYARDIIARYPTLRSKAIQECRPSIFVERVETLQDYKVPHGSELTLVIQEGGEECLWVYNEEVFDEECVAEMQHGFTTFLQGIASDHQQPISRLPLLTKAEQYRLLVEWNATEISYQKQSCIHQLFEEQVKRTPEAVAVVFEDKRLTYWQLNQRANQLAHYLQQLGVQPDVLVGLCVERSLDMVVGLLGILKAGGAYVPFDPGFPSERLSFMLEDAQVSVLVTQQHLSERLLAHKARTVCLDTDQAVLARQRETNLLPTATSVHLAYVIYTSGSTGRPKGVLISHNALANLLLSVRQQPGLNAEDTLLAITTPSFDIAACELFLPLIVGARLVVASSDVIVDGPALMETLIRTCTTVMLATPVTWRLLLAAGWQSSYRLKILCTGEAMPPDLVPLLLPRATSLWNLYGPTETTIWSSMCQIEAEDKVVTIGRPIANTQIYILDGELQPVPIRVPGELYIGGDGLAQGYLHYPELTAEKFIPDPFSKRPNSRLYKTGDVARYLPDGTIEYLGRLDHQVKIRGVRIELGEIEAVLMQYPGVQEAVVVVQGEDTPGDKRLVAYVVLSQEQRNGVDALRSHVMEHVPAYMVPSAFALLESLPLTPNGKVDRRALPAPPVHSYELRSGLALPQTPLQEAIAASWAQVLGIAQVSIHENFFALGGHSLLAMQVLSRLREVLQISLPLHRFFAAPTIAELSQLIEQLKASQAQLPLAGPLSLPRESRRMKLSSLLETQQSRGSRGENQRRIP